MVNTGTFKKGEKKRKQGERGPGKATVAAREAIGMFVDGNVHRLTAWLDDVANGDPMSDIKPNPAKAFELFQSVVEYHVPKLARSEITGKDGGAIVIRASTLDEAL